MNNLRTLMFLLLSVAAATFAQQKPAKPDVKPDVHFDNPRVVQANERIIVPVYLCGLQGTEVTLPKGDLLRQSTVGDSENWVITAVAEDRRDVSIRPREPMTRETILNVTSDHDNRYVFRLILDAGHCDSHITLEADSALEKKIESSQAWVSPDKYQEALKAVEEAKKQAADASEKALQAAQKAAKAAQQSSDKFRETYPKRLVFDYTYDKKKASLFGVSEVFHDDRFTYIKAQSEEPPVLFELKDGKPSLIEVSYADGIYRTARIIDEGYLVRGGDGSGKHQKRLTFKREEKAVQQVASASSTVDGPMPGGKQ